jgi:hypothetical protein
MRRRGEGIAWPGGRIWARQITLIRARADGHFRSTGRPWRRPAVLASPSDASTFGDQLPGSLPKRTAELCPTANEDCLVVPDTLGATIKLPGGPRQSALSAAAK